LQSFLARVWFRQDVDDGVFKLFRMAAHMASTYRLEKSKLVVFAVIWRVAQEASERALGAILMWRDGSSCGGADGGP